LRANASQGLCVVFREVVRAVVGEKDFQRLVVVALDPNSRDLHRAGILRRFPAVITGQDEARGLLRDHRAIEAVVDDALGNRYRIAAPGVLRVRLQRVHRDEFVFLVDDMHEEATRHRPPGSARGAPLFVSLGLDALKRLLDIGDRR